MIGVAARRWKISAPALALAVVIALVVVRAAFAVATITPATGGTNISADAAANAAATQYTALGNMQIDEAANGDFSTGTNVTLILGPPSNWEFSPGVGAVSYQPGRNISAASIAVTATAITVTYTVGGTNKTDRLTISGIEVRAINGALLPSSGNITRTGGTGTINGVPGGANFGPLSQVAGAPDRLGIPSVNLGSSPSAGTTFPVDVQMQDQFGSPTNAVTSTDVSLSLAAGTGTLGGTTTGTIAADSSSATISGVTYTKAESGVQLQVARTSGDVVSSGTSSTFTVNAGSLDHFAVEASGGGAIGTQTAGSSFPIRVSAQDQFDNTVTSFTGTVDLTSNRTIGSGGGTTAAFAAGVLASHSITLTQDGSGSTITATRTSGGTQSGTSNTFGVNPGALDHFAVEAAGGGPIGTQTVDSPFSIRVTAQDQFDNTVTSFTGTVDLTSNRTIGSGGGTTAAFTAGVLTSHSITLTQDGAGSTITATRTSGGTQSGASNTFTVNPGSFTNTELHTISGTEVVDSTLTVSAGTWSPSPTSSAYQWVRCDSDGSNCADIAGATSSTYTLVAADEGKTIKVRETVSKAGYTDGSATSVPTGVIAPGSFTNNALPGIGGTQAVGNTLTAGAGDWSPTPTSNAFQWVRCDADGSNCADIAGATGSTYALAAADQGKKLKVRETVSKAAYNDGSATSLLTGAIAAGSFTNNALPGIAGTQAVGNTLTAGAGDWSPTPTSNAYQWVRCDADGSNCADIAGATASTYALAAADQGKKLKVRETVSKAGYTDASATSLLTGAIAAGSFTNNALPGIAGTQAVGNTLTAGAGDWSPTPTSNAYQWVRCDSDGTNCADIAGATGSTYALVAPDQGKKLKVREIVTRAGYTDGSATSLLTGVIAPGSFTNNALPGIAGTQAVGNTLTAGAGDWSPSPTGSAYQWVRCDSDGSNCADIAGATASTYALVAADQGKKLKVRETASKAGYTDASATSNLTGVIAAGSFTNNALPGIGGTEAVGNTLTASAGDWSPTPTGSAYQWVRCDSDGSNCADIAGETGNTYALAAADQGKKLKVRETASKAGYTDASATSNLTGVIAAGSFTNNALPGIGGTEAVGNTLTASAGDWSPTPTGSAYQWVRCDSDGSNCADIAGATASTYALVAADQGKKLKVRETASKAGYTDGSATSDLTGAIAAGSFTNSGLPGIAGTEAVGNTLTAGAGTWSPTPTSSAYQWVRCDSDGSNCADIAGETGNTYALVAPDQGKKLKVRETASKAGYTDGSATSDLTGAIAAGSFTNNALPGIAGTQAVGNTLTASAGDWSPTPTGSAYQWVRCDSDGSNCADIAGETGNTYALAAADQGKKLKVRETASKAGYTDASATSNLTGVIAAGTFTNSGLPGISGTEAVGNTLTAGAGTWSPTPTSNAWQWIRCDADGVTNCANIAGETASTYALVAADQGKTLKARETVTKAGYTDGSVTSNATGVIAPGTFSNSVLPSISGTEAVGNTLTADAGTWSPAPTGSAYQWIRCDADGTNCADIGGATSTSYALVAADQGKKLKARETASKAGYSDASATSNLTGVIALGTFSNSVLPSISGTEAVGNTLTANAGTWSPAPTSSAYQWVRCDSDGTNCADISGATGSTYALVAADQGKKLKVRETASKAGYTDASATSNLTGVIAAGTFSNSVLPGISGTLAVGNTLTADAGTWSPAPASSAYQWIRCDADGVTNCANIAGETSATYTLVAADQGNTIKVRETASKAGYTDATATSNATAVIAAGSFTNTALPTISGTLAVGSTLTGSAGSWSPTPTSNAFQWVRCDADGSNCADISGATASSYALVAADQGKKLRVRETVSKAGYSDGSAISNLTGMIAAGTFTNTVPPSIAGTEAVGNTLTASAGTWSPAATSNAFQWVRCDADGTSNCADISGATDSTYALVAADQGKTVKVRETVSKAGYSDGSATSNATAVIAAGTFSNSVLPSISGTEAVGNTLTASAGTWSPTPTSSAYQWIRCDADGVTNCANIAGETASTYALVAADQGKTLKVRETASKAGYTDASATSNLTDVIALGTFSNSVLPGISGTEAVGNALTANAGTWSPAPTSSAYQWVRCDADGTNCADISGATASTYALVAADQSKKLKVRETASKAGYTDGSATSSLTGVIALGTFSNSVLPGISGTEAVGNTLTANAGTWSPTPTSNAWQWIRCDVDGTNCADISGATSSSYALVAADQGKKLKVRETVSKAAYADGSATSNLTGVIALGTFTNTVLPSISGTEAVGNTLTASAGTWSPAATSNAFQWVRCDADGTNCADIAGATDSTYALVAADQGKKLRVRETVSKAAYADGSATSNLTGVIALGTFTNTVLPSISGIEAVGNTLTAGGGSWSPAPTSNAWQWVRCDADGTNCADISGATSSTYALVAADQGKKLKVRETASKAGYTDGSATSSLTGVIALGTFTNSVLPGISGTEAVGNTLTADPGTWSPAPTSSAYQWIRCDADGTSNCANITGETSATYTLVAADQGKTLKVRETASKAGYTDASATSNLTGVIALGTFSNSVLPGISGTEAVGNTLTANAGTWSPAPASSAYQWVRCDSDGTNCADIGGATSTSYALVAADQGKKLKVRETASKAGYSDASATSNLTGVIALGTFSNSVLPASSGTPAVGYTLTAAAGTWSPTASSNAFQWVRCDADGTSNCADISGATSGSHALVSADEGKTIKVRETVSKAGYSNASATSAASAVIAAGVFTNDSLPTISGTAQVGSTLTANAGSWTPAPTSSAHQWVRCDSDGSNCADIGGATSNSYALVAADQGKKLKVRETVSRSGYANANAASSLTDVVAAGTFSNSIIPGISGTEAVGSTLTSNAGTWSPAPTSAAYQWVRCDADGTNCADISGATASTYALVAADQGTKLKVRETASKAGYTDATATSALTGAIAFGTFSNTALPTISGTEAVGNTLNATAGTWSPAPTSSAYQWVRCDADGTNCADISGATASSYALVAADQGTKLKVRETASKAGYTDATATSALTGAIGFGTFSNTALPAISGTEAVGNTLTATAGTWSPTATTSSLQWLRCDSDGSNCADITGATAATYALVAADEGKKLKVRETVTKAGYTDSSASSTLTAVIATGTFSNTVLPTVSGTAAVGNTLTATAGTWSPTPTSNDFRWVRCDSDGSNCADIAGATAATYALVAADQGKKLKVREGVTKAGYNDGSATSVLTGAIAAGTFSNTALPTISGAEAVGNTLTVSAGTWSPAPTSSAYQWIRCDADGSDCADISGATSSTYALVAADQGKKLKVRETASKAGYTDANATSDLTGVIAAGTFSNSVLPSIAGAEAVGNTLTATAGTWSPAPTSNAWQWVRCDADGTNCADLGQTSSTYGLVAADEGKTIKARETVSKAGYTDANATSTLTAVIAAGVFSNTALPTVSGTEAVGNTLTATAGTWSPVPTTSSLQWLRCDAAGSNCAAIAGATSGTYALQDADYAKRIRVRETVTKPSYANGVVQSAATGAIADVTDPTTTDDAPAGYRNGPVTVTLSATDAGGSGVGATTYEINAGATQSGGTVSIPGTEGMYTITYRSTDVAGNVEDNRTATVRIDTTAPTTTDNAPAQAGGAVTVTLTPTDTGGSSLAATTYEVNGGATQSGASVSIPNVEGSYTITYRSSDAAGNTEGNRTATVIIDKTPPSAAIAFPAADGNYRATTWNAFSGTAADGLTSVTQVEVSVKRLSDGLWWNGSTWESSVPELFSIAAGAGSWSLAFPAANYLTDGLYEVHARATDAAGNTETGTTRTYRIDRVAPATTDNAPADYRNDAVTVTLSPSDLGGSGVATTTYEVNGGATQTGTSVSIPVTQGTYTITFRSTDAAGNVEADKTATVRIDTTAPTTTDDAPAGYRNGPVTVALSPSDTGGAGVSTTTYEVNAGATLTGTSVSIPGTQGTYTITYRSTDAAGNAEADRTATVRIDTTAPTTTDDAPAAWRNGAVTVTLSPTDSGGAGVQATTYELDGGAMQTGTSVSVPATSGAHTIVYRSTDTASNAESNRTATVNVDVTAPSVSITYPTGGALVSGVVTITTSPASDAHSGVAGVAYSYSVAGANDWQSTSSSWNTAALDDGSYDVRAVVTDNAGNTGQSLEAGVQVDNNPPSLTFSAPAYLNAASADPYTLSATASDGGTGVANVEFFEQSGGSWSSIAADTTGSPYTAAWTLPADGPWTLKAVATDNVGHPTEQTVTLTVDRTPPTATMADPGAYVRGTIELSAAASDATTSVTSVAFQRSPAGGDTWTTIATDTNGADGWKASLDTTGLSDGLYDVRVFVTDAAGNSSTSTVASRRVDNTKPTAGITDPGSFLRGTVALAGSATDGGSGVASVEFQRSPAGAATWTTIGTDTTEGDGWSADLVTTSLTDGLYDLRVVVTDRAGNSETSSIGGRRVDNTKPTAAVADPGEYLRGTIGLSGTATDDGSGVASVEFQRSPAGASTWTQIAVDADGGDGWSASFVTTGVADDLYDLRVVVTDRAGNSETATVATRRVDNTKPTAGLTDPGANLRSTVTLTGTATDAGSGVASVAFERSAAGSGGPWTAIGTDTDGADGWSASFDTAAAGDGLYDLRVVVTDRAGNSETATVPTRRVDNTAPTTGHDAPGGPAASDVTVTLTPNDSGSGASATQYRVDGGPWLSGTSVLIPAPSDHSNDGSHTLELYSTDAAGNVEGIQSVTVVIDTTGASAGPTDPGAYLRGVVTLEASPADTSGIVSVEFQFSPAGMEAWAAVGTDLVAPYSVTWDTTTVGDGQYDLRVRVVDGAGNVTTTNLPSLPKVVDNASPTGSVTAPAASAYVSGTVTVSASASDTPVASAISSVEFQVKPSGASEFGSLGTDTSSPYTASWDTSAVPDGPAELRVVVTDLAGNPAFTSAARTVNVDNDAPTLEFTHPSADISGTVTLNASGSGDLASVTFQRSPVGANSWTAIATVTSAPFQAGFDTTAVSDGQYDLRAVGTDGSGNTGASPTRTLRVDNTAPTGSMSQPQNGGTVGGPAITLAASTNDAGSGVASVTFQQRPDGSGSFTDISGSTWDATGLATGLYEVRAVVRDNAGNEQTTAAVTVTVDSTAPTVSLANPGASLQGSVALTASVSGAGAASVAFGIAPAGSGTWTQVGSDATSPYSFSLNTAGVADGVYDLRAVVADQFGNTNSDVRTGIRIDNTPPKVASSTPADGAVVASVATISVTASEALLAVDDVKLDGAAAGATPSGSSFSVDASALGAGPHMLRGKLRDLAGRTKPFRVHFTIVNGSTADVPYVERNAARTAPTTLTAVDASATVTMPAGAWSDPGTGDWLVLRVDPVPAAAIAGPTSLIVSAIVDVTARWALAETEQHDFNAPLDILVANTGGEGVLPATLEGGSWRTMAAIPGGATTLPAGWSDGFYRDGGAVHVLTLHLSKFSLLRDIEAPEPPGAGGVVAEDGLTLRWYPGRDNSGLIRRITLLVNGVPYQDFDPTQFEEKMGPFDADDTRVFSFIQQDAAGNWSAESGRLRSVPGLAGKTLAEAETALTERGFSLGAVREEPSPTALPGTVIEPSGVLVAAMGSTVDLVVAAGAAEAADSRLVFGVVGTKKFSWKTGKSIAVRVKTTRAAKVTVSLMSPRGERVYTWRFSVKAGRTIKRLRMPRQVRRAGKYRLVVTATSGGQVVRRTIRVQIVKSGPAGKRGRPPQRQPVEIVLAGSSRVRKDIALGLDTAAARIIHAEGGDAAFAAIGSPRRNVQIVVVDVDRYGVGLVRDLHVVFPSVKVIALSRRPALLLRALKSGAAAAVPPSAPAPRIARVIRSLSGR